MGKTSVIKKIIPLLETSAGGFFTEEIRVMDRRMGFRIVTLDGKEGIMAHVDCNSNYKVGKYRVDLDSFERVAIPALENAMKDKSIIVIDEIGKMELFSATFRELVLNILDGEKPLLCVIKENGDAFTEEIKNRRDVSLVTVNYENREGLPEKVLDMLKVMKKYAAITVLRNTDVY